MKRVGLIFRGRIWAMAALLLLPAWPTLGESAEPWTLERALDQALANNPDMRVAQHRMRASRAALEQAQAAFWPKLQFQSSYLRSDNPLTVFGAALNQESFEAVENRFNDVPDADNFNAKGLLTLPLYRGGQTRAGHDQAQANHRVSVQQAGAVRNTLAYEVARTFNTALKTREFIRAAGASVTAFERNLAVARNRFKAGTALKTAVLDLEVRLAQAREDLVQARNAHRLALHALRNLLGMEAGDIEVAEEVPSVPAPSEEPAAMRPELAAAKAQVEAAQAAIRHSRGGYLPRVDAFGSLDYDYGWKFDGSGESYTTGLLLQWDLWDGRMTRSKVSEAEAHLGEAMETSRKVRLAIALELEQARLNLKEAEERLAVTGTMVDQAAESARITRNRFEEGLALPAELIDAETALTSAEVRRAQAQADRRIAIAALRKALALPQLESSHPIP